jgi:hypothetical protein
MKHNNFSTHGINNKMERTNIQRHVYSFFDLYEIKNFKKKVSTSCEDSKLTKKI